MNGKQLKNSILQWAIQGKLVPQDPNDEPASVLLDKIRQEKERLIKEKKIKRDKNASIIYRGEDNSYYEKILATGEVKCIDEEIPFEISRGWEWCRIRNISQSYIGLTYSPSEVSSQGTIVLRSSNIQDGRIVFDDIVRVTKNISEKLLVEKNDIIICARNGSAKLVGKSAIVTEITEPMTFGAFMAICKTSLYQYVSIFLQSDLFFSQLRGVSGTTTINQLTQSNFNNFLIAIPPLEEQHRIFEKVNDVLPIVEIYGNKQEQLNRLNDNLRENVKKSILQEAIQGKLVSQIAKEGTAQELLEQIKAEKQRLVKEGKLKKSALNDSVIFHGDDNKYYELIDNSPVCIDEFLPFQIPETWTWCKVKDLLEIQTGASFKKEQANANKKGIRILRGGNILPNKYIFKDDDVFVSEEFVNANTILKKNCIITPAVTSLENIGKMAVIEKDYNNVSAGGFVFIISPYIQDFNHSLLLAYFLQSPFLIEAMRGITKKSGAAFYNLGKERLKELYLPLPPMAEQRRIVDKINEVLSSIMSR